MEVTVPGPDSAAVLRDPGVLLGHPGESSHVPGSVFRAWPRRVRRVRRYKLEVSGVT